ncbi:MAG: nicotinate-nicotinamide nucleotide adenylyltransferase, partial [Acidimicrobiales bacterium]
RLALVEAAVQGFDGIEASSMEIERGGTSYTADTIAELEQRYSSAELSLVVGADVAAQLDSWERIEEVKSRVRLVVVNRPGTLKALDDLHVLAGWEVMSVEIPALEISSTDLRRRAATGRPLDFLVPDPAIRVLRDRGLYGGAR